MLQTDFAPQSPLAKLSQRRAKASHQSRDHQDASHVLHRFPMGSVLISAFLCLLGIGVFMWPRIQSVRLAYRVQSAEQRLRDLTQERDHLRRELAVLSDPQRVYRMATEQLGMVPPSHDQRFILMYESQNR